MRALIIDDEPLARRGVVHSLREFKNVEVAGECGDGPSAVEAILRLSPDLIFLDIQMPGMDGFEVLRAVPRDKLPAVIFFTAYDKYVLQAFDVHALHYLLKPLDDARFAEAVSRAHRLIEATRRADMAQRVADMLESTSARFASRFIVHTGSCMQVIMAEDVAWIGAAGDYVELHVDDRTFLLRETMHSIEQRLDPAHFLRIHRSRIVRSNNIVELRSLGNREFLVKLQNSSQHRSSRTYADRIDRWIASS